MSSGRGFSLSEIHRQTGFVVAAAKEAFEERSLTDASHGKGHVSFLCDVARMMARLLARQPISHPPEGDSGQMSHPAEGHSGQMSHPAEGHNRGLQDAKKLWSTPTEAQWEEIQTVACRCQLFLN